MLLTVGPTVNRARTGAEGRTGRIRNMDLTKSKKSKIVEFYNKGTLSLRKSDRLEETAEEFGITVLYARRVVDGNA